MRILFTVDPEIPVPPKFYGGIERVVDSLILELTKRGHEIGLLAHPDSTCPTIWKGAWPGLRSQGREDTLKNILRMDRAIRHFRPDVVHSFSRIAYFGRHLLTKLPKVMSYQRVPSRPTVAMAAKLTGSSLAFTGCSSHIAASGRKYGGTWYEIPNFIDPDKFTFQSEVPLDAPLVFLSRIEPIKGCHTAIQIAKLSGRRLLIAGNRVETGSAAGYWEREIAPHLGQNGIEYVGTVNDEQKNQLLGSAAAMVVPIEWNEPFGIVFAESLGCGTPVITCPWGAAPEIITNGLHGFIINNAEEGAAAVDRLSTISRQVCLDRMNSFYTVSRVTDQYLAIYKNRVVPQYSNQQPTFSNPS
jgi:glycosyltransferase involved in cell wall biosynthesis